MYAQSYDNFQVEYILVKFDDENKTAQVSLRAEEVLAKLNEKEAADPNGKEDSDPSYDLYLHSSVHLISGVKSLWRPEYGAYMVKP